jgi:hypothetical protein
VRALSFRERMREEAAKAAAAESTDPWRLTLQRVRSKVDFFDGGTFRRLSKVMAGLGWTAVRVRDLTRGGYKEQVRGYCRDARDRRPIHYS